MNHKESMIIVTLNLKLQLQGKIYVTIVMHTHVTRTVTVPNTSGADATVKNNNKKVIFKNCIT